MNGQHLWAALCTLTDARDEEAYALRRTIDEAGKSFAADWLDFQRMPNSPLKERIQAQMFKIALEGE